MNVIMVILNPPAVNLARVDSQQPINVTI